MFWGKQKLLVANVRLVKKVSWDYANVKNQTRQKPWPYGLNFRATMTARLLQWEVMREMHSEINRVYCWIKLTLQLWPTNQNRPGSAKLNWTSCKSWCALNTGKVISTTCGVCFRFQMWNETEEGPQGRSLSELNQSRELSCLLGETKPLHQTLLPRKRQENSPIIEFWCTGHQTDVREARLLTQFTVCGRM